MLCNIFSNFLEKEKLLTNFAFDRRIEMNVYVHIPFCRRKCIYCDFYSVGERCADWPALTDALLHEAGERLPDFPSGEWPSTLYIGGGTPSLMPDAEFRRLASGLLSFYKDTVSEFTIEVNPDDVTPRKIEAWKSSGVNRVSMGVQSLCDAELKAVGRRHDSACAMSAARMLREAFGNISLDVMFGLPGQSLESLENTLRGVIALQPDHVSVYSLMYEENTALTRLRDTGRLREADDDLSARMFSLVHSMLLKAGYGQYEISNYARPGFESRHNGLYWRGLPYAGLGPGAHSYDGKRLRSANIPDFKRYIDRFATANPNMPARNGAPISTEEILSDDELREEMVMTRLRIREGIPLQEYCARFGETAYNRLVVAANPWLESGMLRRHGDALSLTPEGVMISDEIMSSLF